MSNILLVGPANSIENQRFMWPVACELGKNCWVMNYLDTDPTEGLSKDFACGPRSYDGHKGLDIAIRSGREMKEGIAVLSVADGTIYRTRASEDDKFLTREELDKIRAAKKECGNGLMIDHGDGIISHYCHLQKNSITVKPGDKVVAGQPIAKIGMSGVTEHPHLHLSIYQKGKIIDPLTGLESTQACGTKERTDLTFRKKFTTYEPFALYDGGFTTQVPDFDTIAQGQEQKPVTASSPALVFWAGILGLQVNDEVTMVLRGPDGMAVAERNIKAEKTRARQFYYLGKKRKDADWASGNYKGEVVLKRAGSPPVEQRFNHELVIK